MCLTLKKGFKLSQREIALAFSITALSIILTLRPVLLFLNQLNPFIGMLVYYAILFGCLTVLGHFGLVIFDVKIKKPLQTLGLLLITFSFFLAVGLSSGYVHYVTTGTFEGLSTVMVQCEDGSVWYLFSLLIPLTSEANVFTVWILTYAVTPFVLALIGGLLAFDKPKLGF